MLNRTQTGSDPLHPQHREDTWGIVLTVPCHRHSLKCSRLCPEHPGQSRLCLKHSRCWDRCLCGKSWTGQSHTQGFSRTGLDITKGALNAPGQLWTIYGHREHMLAYGLAGLVCTYIPRTIWLHLYGWSMDYPYYMRPIIVWLDCFKVACLLMILTIP